MTQTLIKGPRKLSTPKRPKVTKKYGVDFGVGDREHYGAAALTLKVSEVSHRDVDCGRHTRKHDDGWIISGVVHEDYYTWVNRFDAMHPKLGHVWGDFEHEVFADSEKGFDHFYANHGPTPWDYHDI